MIYGDGEKARDFVFVYVADVVKMNILVARSGETGAFNISGGRSTGLNESVSIMGTIAERCLRLENMQSRPGDIRDSPADINLAEKIGYVPEYPVEEGLRRHWPGSLCGRADC